MKRIVWSVIAVLVVLVLGVGGLFASAFMGLKPAVDGVVAPGVQLVRDGFSNAFIVDLDDESPAKAVALIDCGNDPTAASLKAALASRKLEPTQVKAIFLTHGHPDHVGGCKQFPSAKLYGFEGDRALIEGTGAAKGPLPRFFKPDAARGLTGVTWLKDGDTTTVGATPVVSWHIPGHTAGSAAYLARGVLFLGDSAGVTSESTLKPAPWLFSDDVEQCRGSLAKLAGQVKGLAVTHLACAHSGQLDGVTALVNFK